MITHLLKRERLGTYCKNHECKDCKDVYPILSKYCKKYNFTTLDKSSRFYMDNKLVDKIYDDITLGTMLYDRITKPDLKTGMKVTFRNGEEYTVLRNVGSIQCFEEDCEELDIFHCLSTGHSINLKEYDFYLGHRINPELDIVEVKVEMGSLDRLFAPSDSLETIYSAEEKVKLTLEEIEQRLGYKIELVKE